MWWRSGRWSVGVAVVVAAACATTSSDLRSRSGQLPREPFSRGLAALAARDYDAANEHLAEAARRYPILEDYTLYYRARVAARADRPAAGLESTQALLDRYPESVWVRPARLLRGELLRAAGDLPAARDWLGAARAAWSPGCGHWARATVELSEVESELGDPSAALDLATEARRTCPRHLTARRARRLIERVREEHPELEPPDPVDEAELRVREGDAAGARELATRVLETELAAPERARALWAHAQAERALGERTEAEATCLHLARTIPADPLAARALLAAGTWHWNADDDAGALTLLRELVDHFPSSPQAIEARYAIGRIQQEEGHYHDAYAAYSALAQRYPNAPLADEARWRAGWVRYLAGDFAVAERTFATVASHQRPSARAAADYWRARAIERLGQTGEARARFANLIERHPTSYYADLAAERLGQAVVTTALPTAPPTAVFPSDLEGPHADRARLLAQLGQVSFARREVGALRAGGAPLPRVLEAYEAIGAPGPAIRLARAQSPQTDDGLDRYLYPLGYWDTVLPTAQARSVDPLLVVALIRQESLFDPTAVSPTDARGVMQLMPATARELSAAAGTTPPASASLHDVTTNVTLGVTLLARLLERYGGSRPKALAAYNAGDQAVAKWERRYPGREPDEFVELISYRETRDYVKAVLGNYRVYRTLYVPAVPPPNASASNRGRPPKAPFDMITSTSPGAAVATR